MNNADLSWMLVSTLLVLMMAAPGLALFYSGMVRQKNALSMLSQTLLVFSLGVVLWFIYGYSLAFTAGNPLIGSFDKVLFNGIAFLAGWVGCASVRRAPARQRDAA